MWLGVKCSMEGWGFDVQKGTVVGKERVCVMCINFHHLDNKETLQDFKWANDMIMFAFWKGYHGEYKFGMRANKTKEKNQFCCCIIDC